MSRMIPPRSDEADIITDPFTFYPDGPDSLSLGKLILYGLDEPEDYPANYRGPTAQGDPVLIRLWQKHRRASQS